MFTREQIDQIRHMVRPLKNRIANTIARAVVQVIDEEKKMQILQLGILADEDGDDCENFQGFGFKSVPLPGAEAVAVYPNGDRAVPLVVATEDRRYRPTGWAGGEAGVYNAHDAIVRLREDGTIEAGTAAGAKIPLATKADLDAFKAWVDLHTHSVPAAPGTSAVPLTLPSPTAAGTSKLKAE